MVNVGAGLNKIKYRVWNADSGKMEYDGYVVSNEGSVYELKETSGTCAECDNNCVCLVRLFNCAAMPFSGHQDCDGVDIYVGDILKVKATGKLVVLEQDFGQIYEPSQFKVMGNVYKNPTLLILGGNK